jgi:REP element-mobilizing transposase RayT
MRQRKTIRLPRSFYKGQSWFFVTICCDQHHPHFSDPRKAMWLEERIRSLAVAQHFFLHAWCIMPNHVHLLTKGADEGSDLIPFVIHLKQTTAYEAAKRFGVQLWQRSFYDHRLSAPSSVERVAAYIWMNPVRKGLCKDVSQYPFSGSATLDWRRQAHVSDPIEPWIPPWKKTARHVL